MLDQISTRIFADGADLDAILALAADPNRGLHDQSDADVEGRPDRLQEFAKRLLEQITTHPISFEVFADDVEEIRRQALMIAAGARTSTSRSRHTTSGESMAR
jgi:transaldolase